MVSLPTRFPDFVEKRLYLFGYKIQEGFRWEFLMQARRKNDSMGRQRGRDGANREKQSGWPPVEF